MFPYLAFFSSRMSNCRAEQNTLKNTHFSPSVSWSTLAQKPAIFEVAGFTDYKKKKKIPELRSWLAYFLFHSLVPPWCSDSQTFQKHEGSLAWKERRGRKRQHLLTPYLRACDICHGLTEHVKTSCRHGTGEVDLSRGDSNESKPHTQTSDLKPLCFSSIGNIWIRVSLLSGSWCPKNSCV